LARSAQGRTASRGWGIAVQAIDHAAGRGHVFEQPMELFLEFV
jgi:hypothetical protein